MQDKYTKEKERLDKEIEKYDRQIKKLDRAAGILFILAIVWAGIIVYTLLK